MTFYERLTAGRSNNSNSSSIKKLFKSEKDSITIGLTKVSIDYDIIKIEHSGREYHKTSDIDENLFVMGLGSIETMKKHFDVLSETGNPNYYYVIKIQL